jgi:hypothetical protein
MEKLPGLLVQLVPGLDPKESYTFDWQITAKTHRSMMLITMMNPPGVWIIIMGTLSAPTSLRR